MVFITKRVLLSEFPTLLQKTATIFKFQAPVSLVTPPPGKQQMGTVTEAKVGTAVHKVPCL